VNTAKRIAELRSLTGLSQQDLADRLFVSRTLVSKWENGTRRPDAANAAAMARIFGVSSDSIVSYDETLISELYRCVPRDLNIPPERLPELADAFLAQLGENERNVFIRRYHFLEDQRLIAERFGISYSAVRSALSRTRKKLRSFLTERRKDGETG